MPQLSQPLISMDQFEMWAQGLDHPEGVACAADGTVWAGGEAGQIYRISPEGKPQQIASTGGFILGLCLDADSNVYACDIVRRAVMRITPAGQVSTYSSGSPDRPMVNPNYPVFDAQGNLYLADSGHWKQNDGCVYRISPGGGKAEVISAAPNQFPNGLALSADGRTLYVVLSLMPGVVELTINSDGSVSQPRPVVSLPDTIPDGAAIDVEGNLYITCYTPDVIYRRTPGGELSVLAYDPEHTLLSSPTNIAFCGRDRKMLVVANLGRWHLARTYVTVPGQRLNYPKI